MYHPIIDRLKRIVELLPNAIGGGGADNCYSFTTTVTRSTGNVLLGELPDYILSHIHDDTCVVSVVNTTPANIQNNDDYYIIAANIPNLPTDNTGHTTYGIGLRKVSTSVQIQANKLYYKPDSSNNELTLGGIGKIYIDGSSLMYKSNSYYFAAGTYIINIGW